MSNLSVNTITDASGGSTASINGLTPQASNMQPFNRIINGAMTVDQRNAGAAVTPTDGQYTLDRYETRVSQANKLTIQQSSVAPAGFTKSLLVTSSSAYSITASDYFAVCQSIEGFNVADLGFGTASAQTVTLSFWVRSSFTGTFGGSITNSSNRFYPFTYSISASNTWEQKSVTIVGDTTGTWVANNGKALQLSFGLGCGSTFNGTAGAWNGTSGYFSATGATSVVATSGATFYITGVQLEAGSFGSSFAHENVADTLQKCQRYYYSISEAQIGGATLFGIGTFYDGSDLRVIVNLPVTMRATPTIESSSTTDDFRLLNAGGSDYFTEIVSAGGNYRTAAHLYKGGLSGTGGQSGVLISGTTGIAYIGFKSEL